MEVPTTVGILSKLPNSFPTRVLKLVHVGIAYPHFRYAFTSWGKAPATCKNNKDVLPPHIVTVILGWNFKLTVLLYEFKFFHPKTSFCFF